MAAKHFGMTLKTNISKIRSAFVEGINSVQPQELIKQFIRRENETLIVKNEKYKLNHNVYIVGFGKAVIGMVRPLESELRAAQTLSHVQGGILSVPVGIRNTFADRLHLLPSDESTIEIIEGAKDNIPDDSAFHAAKRITSLIEKLNENDLLIVLISGGGSALLPYPLPPTTLDEKKELVKFLSKAGASITELNTVRKALSATKGGKLAMMTKARTVTLILSDVINSPLDIIASGPTVVNKDSADAAIRILEKYCTLIPEHTRETLLSKAPSHSPEDFPHVTNVVIGSNETALSAVSDSLSHGSTMILSSTLQGEAASVGRRISDLATVITSIISGDGDPDLLTDSLLKDLYVNIDKREIILDAIKKTSITCPLCLIFGGETTVQVRGTGCGGRNQEMVLAFSLHQEKILETSKFNGQILFLSGGTDGIDGPTDAAGAISYGICSPSGYSSQIQEARQQSLDPESYIANNDSYTYFSLLSNGQYLLKPGHTGTNVMDLQILLICPAQESSG